MTITGFFFRVCSVPCFKKWIVEKYPLFPMSQEVRLNELFLLTTQKLAEAALKIAIATPRKLLVTKKIKNTFFLFKFINVILKLSMHTSISHGCLYRGAAFIFLKDIKARNQFLFSWQK